MTSQLRAVGFGGERGSTLLIALIMLIMITLMVVTSFKIGSGNLKIVANAQDRQRATTIAEELLNEKLFDINSGLSSDPCDMTALLAEDGTLTETRDNVAVTFSRTLTRAECVSKNSVVDPLKLAEQALLAAEATVVQECAAEAENSAECLQAKADRDNKRAIRDRTQKRALECITPGESGGSHVGTDPALGSAAEDAAVAGSTYCVDVVMELTAEARDSISGARGTVMRGIALHCSNHDIPEC
ncbi:hypothetical protein [Azoarcus sp. DD4]|uniref:pilus assembly PilX family protein n=1 Tax=Azoarcus sp. DD4 TaxID=2027405 RepID=UPI001128F744|nr:hypothetical protein [Azoarcus sp. DD4]